jgi:NADP-dependent 3-hydroxy acid dehydrogenase YdfG
MAARDKEKMKLAIEDILSTNKEAELVPLDLDLGDSESIDKCVDEFLKKESELNILINNAGVMMTPEKKTKDVNE